MKKRKVLRFLLLCLGIVGSASAVEVINIDINNYGNEAAYDGQGAYPGGAGWKRVAGLAPDVKGDTGFGRLFVNWVLGIVVVYSVLFGLGELLFGSGLVATLLFLLAVGAAWIIWRDLKARGLGAETVPSQVR